MALDHSLNSRVSLAVYVNPFEPDEVVLTLRKVQPGRAEKLRLQLVDVPDEVRDKLSLGIVVDVVGVADLLDDAFVEYCDTVRERQSFLLVVRNIDRRDAELALHLLQLVAELNTELRVEVAQRLVHADDRRACNKSAGYGNSLLLTSRELAHGFLELLG